MENQFPEFIYKFPKASLPSGVDGISNLLSGPEGQVVFHTIPKGQRIPLHCHGDSLAILMSGALEITLGQETFTAKGCISWFIPADAMHSGNALEDSLLIEVFCEKRFSPQMP